MRRALVAFLLAVALPTWGASRQKAIKTLHRAGEPRLELTRDHFDRAPKYRPFSDLKYFSDETLFGKMGPHWSDVRQGNLGDCYFLAALSAFAHVDPQRLAKQFVRDAEGKLALDAKGRAQAIFFRRGPNGRYQRDLVPITAKFPIGKNGEPLFARADSKLWVAALEKAWVSWQDQIKGNGGWPDAADTKPGWDRIRGGFSALPIEAFTGVDAASFDFTHRNTNARQLFSLIQTLLQDKRMVVAGTVASNKERNKRVRAWRKGWPKTRETITYSHAFSVLDAFERKGKQFVLLHDSAANHVFKLSMDDFTMLFMRLSFEGTVATN